MRKFALLIFLSISAAIALSGCQKPAQRSGDFSLEPEQMVNLYYMAGTFGMTVTVADDRIILSNEDNTVIIYPEVDQVYVNNQYIAPLGRTRKIDGMLHVRSGLEEQIRSSFKVEIKPIVPKPVPVPKIPPKITGATIVIDPGHGGKDPGAISTYGFYEKTVNLDVAMQISDILKKQGCNIIMTRDRDVFIELEERADIANRNRAKLFISIHADSCNTKNANGFTLYVARNASQAAKMLATSIDGQMPQTGIKSRGIKQADFKVLKHTRCPAVLIELGYLSNYWEAKQLKNQDMQRRLANAIADGITDYLKHK
ncbi:MAG: N-acetylmuramoyl-L-alanine amidase [Sedimentisphaerales bacterium]|nr:N-acetylmuramoyl-L-alanine amidase [Sedimentisphaerales bacterium]